MSSAGATKYFPSDGEETRTILLIGKTISPVIKGTIFHPFHSCPIDQPLM